MALADAPGAHFLRPKRHDDIRGRQVVVGRLNGILRDLIDPERGIVRPGDGEVTPGSPSLLPTVATHVVISGCHGSTPRRMSPGIERLHSPLIQPPTHLGAGPMRPRPRAA